MGAGAKSEFGSGCVWLKISADGGAVVTGAGVKATAPSSESSSYSSSESSANLDFLAAAGGGAVEVCATGGGMKAG